MKKSKMKKSTKTTSKKKTKKKLGTKKSMKTKAKTNGKVVAMKRGAKKQISPSKGREKIKGKKKSPYLAKKTATKKRAQGQTMKKSLPLKAAKAPAAAQLPVGSEVPPLVLQDSQGKEHNLSEFKGKKVVLYFYPKDDTPGCTLEGQQFTQLHSEFEKNNTLVFGISRDSVKSHDKFKCKYNFGFELLSDEKEEASKLFDVIKEKNMYGKVVMGIERSTFVIDEQGKLVKEYRKVSADGHAAQVLEDLKTLG
jgi:thioredoxin-dependent peroxiredoxin